MAVVIPVAGPMQDDAPWDVMKIVPMPLEVGGLKVKVARIVPRVSRAMVAAMSMTAASMTAAAEAKSEAAADNVDAESAAANHAVRFRTTGRSFDRQITCL